jgi:hypothetical protein
MQHLAAFLEDLFYLCEVTLSLLASFQGRVQHYSVCLPSVLPFMALLSSIIGTEREPDHYYSSIFLQPVVNERGSFRLRRSLSVHFPQATLMAYSPQHVTRYLPGQ